jgi:hypothetical protein
VLRKHGPNFDILCKLFKKKSEAQVRNFWMNNKVRGMNLIKTLKLNSNCDKKVRQINTNYRDKLKKRMVLRKVDGVRRKVFKGGILRVTGV